MRQMMPLTGLDKAKIQFPPIWALGHHLCRNTSDQEMDFQQHIKSLSNSTESILTIPYDSDCIGQSLMKTAFCINDNEYEDDENAFKFLSKDFELLKRYEVNKNT